MKKTHVIWVILLTLDCFLNSNEGKQCWLAGIFLTVWGKQANRAKAHARAQAKRKLARPICARVRARIGPFRLCARIALLRARASRFLLIRDIYILICKWHYEFKFNEIMFLLQQFSIAQLVEHLISMRKDSRSNLGLASGFCSFKILNYNAAKCL